MAVDADGKLIEVIITDATIHDVKVAPDLVSKLDLNSTETLCADKGDDSEKLREQIKKTKIHANIPRKSDTQLNNDHMDWHLYKIRHLVEIRFTIKTV